MRECAGIYNAMDKTGYNLSSGIFGNQGYKTMCYRRVTGAF
jgi:hypothetical protein